jgi:protein O-GlcNAcase / histone acetyltransferase
MSAHPDFLAGVIEGFYGQPWSRAERLELFDWMDRWELNTYLYAPKDDLKHRVLWREPYASAEADVLSEAIGACKQRDIRFVFALSPGLDIRYSSESDWELLRKRFEQMLALSCGNFALLFDDIPDRLHPEDGKRWGSFGSAQCHLANALFAWTRERCPQVRFLFCPTPYCGRMAERGFGGTDYLPTLGRELRPEIDVLWTGPEIISREITVAHIQEVQGLLHRKPLIWDNLHANDYDGRRFYCGPYSGRSPALRGEVSGLLANPNNEFPLNYVPLRTMAAFVNSDGAWEPRKAYLSAMAEWLLKFATVTQPVALEDLILFGDCYYLPHEQGPEAVALFRSVQRLVTQDAAEWKDEAAVFRDKATRLRAFCARMTELSHRSLFHALSRRIWELREELDLLDGYVQTKSRKSGPGYISGFHLPGTYRGGLVARLQRLLELQADGSWRATRAGECKLKIEN